MGGKLSLPLKKKGNEKCWQMWWAGNYRSVQPIAGSHFNQLIALVIGWQLDFQQKNMGQSCPKRPTCPSPIRESFSFFFYAFVIRLFSTALAISQPDAPNGVLRPAEQLEPDKWLLKAKKLYEKIKKTSYR